MSRLVSFLMLLSLMVMVVVVAHPLEECMPGFERREEFGGFCGRIIALEEKREALDAPMPHKTKRGEFIV